MKGQRNSMGVIGVVLTLGLTAGCLLDRPIKSPSGRTADELYKEGVSQTNSKNYRQAVESFYKLKYDFPAEAAAMLADLKIADAYYANKDYQEAIESYEDFRKMHPASSYIPYVVYMLGLCHYKKMSSVDRDQTNTERALTEFQYLLTHFPQTPYAYDSHEKAQECMGQLSAHEVYVGDFYFRMKKYRAAIQRYEAALKRFPSVPLEDETLFRLAEAYRHNQQDQMARKAYQVLGTQYPKSKYAKKARDRLEDLSTQPQESPVSSGSSPAKEEAESLDANTQSSTLTASALPESSEQAPDTSAASGPQAEGPGDAQMPEPQDKGPLKGHAEDVSVALPSRLKGPHELETDPGHLPSTEEAEAPSTGSQPPAEADAEESATQIQDVAALNPDTLSAFQAPPQTPATATVQETDRQEAQPEEEVKAPPSGSQPPAETSAEESATQIQEVAALNPHIPSASQTPPQTPATATVQETDRQDAQSPERLKKGSVALHREAETSRGSEATDQSLQETSTSRDESEALASSRNPAPENEGHPPREAGSDGLGPSPTMSASSGLQQSTPPAMENARKGTEDQRSAPTEDSHISEKASEASSQDIQETSTPAASQKSSAKGKDRGHPRRQNPGDTGSPGGGLEKALGFGELRGDQPINITADRMDAFQKENRVVFEGNVVVNQEDTYIYAQHITADLVDKDQGGGIRKVVALRDVRISKNDQVATCDKAEFDHMSRIIELSGNPKIWQGKDRIDGDKVFVNLDQEKMTVVGTDERRVSAVIYPKSGKRSDKSRRRTKGSRPSLTAPLAPAQAAASPEGQAAPSMARADLPPETAPAVEGQGQGAHVISEETMQPESTARAKRSRGAEPSIEPASVRAEDEAAQIASAALREERSPSGSPRPEGQPDPAKGPVLETAEGAGARQSVKSFIEGWRRAWESKDLETYMACYSKRFRSGKRDWSAWRDHKIKLYQQARFIQIELEEIQIAPNHRGVKVSFIQRYHSDHHQDTGEKMLELVKEDGQWKILKEDWRAL